MLNLTIMWQGGDALYCKLYDTILFANQTYICQSGDALYYNFMTGSSHRGRSASDFSTFPLLRNIIYIPSFHYSSKKIISLYHLHSFLGVKVQSDAHYSSKKIISLYHTSLLFKIYTKQGKGCNFNC